MARWSRRPRPAVTAWLLAWLLAALALPAAAQAHGAVDPAASSYLARVGQVPEGTDAKVVDGDLRLWLKASPRTSVVVLDYRGAPYLRFTRAGVFVNRASSMWYLNQVPAQTPPIGLTARTTPRWQRASGGHSYEWHDGRLHALASAARPAGATYIGRWNVPLRLGGVPTAITGGLYFAPGPSRGGAALRLRAARPAGVPGAPGRGGLPGHRRGPAAGGVRARRAPQRQRQRRVVAGAATES